MVNPVSSTSTAPPPPAGDGIPRAPYQTQESLVAKGSENVMSEPSPARPLNGAPYAVPTPPLHARPDLAVPRHRLGARPATLDPDRDRLPIIYKRRLHRAAKSYTCVKCGKTLGQDAVKSADKVWSEHVSELMRTHPGMRFRMVKTTDAICLDCGTEYPSVKPNEPSCWPSRHCRACVHKYSPKSPQARRDPADSTPIALRLPK